jgi:hypothetical protein
MLAWGTMGSRDLPGRRYQRRAIGALAVMLGGLVAAAFLKLRPVLAAGPALTAVYIAYEFRRYLGAVDELARRVLLESIAWTYFGAGVLALVGAGIALAYGFHPDAFYIMGFLGVMEGCRGVALYFVARHYR